MKKILVCLIVFLLITGGALMSEAKNLKENDWDKVFKRSGKVDVKKVSFKNRYGITLVGDLYIPKGAKGKLAAIAVSGPFGAVKE